MPWLLLLQHIYACSFVSYGIYVAWSLFNAFYELFIFIYILYVGIGNVWYFFQLFIGWEGVGLCSYLSINFWFTRILANKAALKAMIMNRIADVFFISAIIILFIRFKTTDFIIIFNLIPFIVYESSSFLGYSIFLINLIAFFLFFGAIGKSAQIGLHTWLPDAWKALRLLVHYYMLQQWLQQEYF